MDVGDILSFKPAATPKRPPVVDSDDEDDDFNRQRKIRRLARARAAEAERSEKLHRIKEDLSRNGEDDDNDETLENGMTHDERLENGVSHEERAQIDRLLASQESDNTNVIDAATVKRLILLFEKRSLKNQEMRIKFPDHPEKFMESEVHLHEAIQELHVIATMPDLYPVLVEMNAIPSLLELLSHQNTDIIVGVLDLLQELTDVDILNESEEGAEVLVDSLLDQQICTLLVECLEKLDENVKEESDGIHNDLAIFENLIEFRPDICATVSKQGLLMWLLRRLRSKMQFDSNKLYASEILSILLQDTPENREYIGEIDGIDVLLQQLAYYKRHDPFSTEEHEYMENLFNCLCSCLLHSPNRDRFLNGEGVQLMNLMLRERKVSRNGSLKVLNYALTGPEGKDSCVKLVDILGLRTIFPLFMKTPKRNRKGVFTVEEHEEHVLSVICSILKNCEGPQLQRILIKFIENDLEKVDRLIELHFKYLEKVESIDDEIEETQRLDHTEMNEDEIYMKRLDGGLFTLQLIDHILLEVCFNGPSQIKQRAVQSINLRGGSLKTVRHIMREYAGNLGDAGNSEAKEAEEMHILQLIDRF